MRTTITTCGSVKWLLISLATFVLPASSEEIRTYVTKVTEPGVLEVVEYVAPFGKTPTTSQKTIWQTVLAVDFVPLVSCLS